MIMLTPADYMIVALVCLAAALHIVGDIRDVVAAKSMKATMNMIVRRKFSPELTIIIPLESLERTKLTLKHLNGIDLSLKVVVCIDTKTHSRDVGALRYFIRKHTLEQTKVTARKNPHLLDVAGRHAKTGLVAVVPDTARLHGSFYDDAVVPFGDETVDVLRFVPDTRPDKTVMSGIEVLFTSWRRYISLNGVRRPGMQPGRILAEGTISRAARIRRGQPDKKPKIVSVRKPVYSTAPQPNVRSAWRLLRGSVGAADYSVVLALIVAAILMRNSHDAAVTLGVFALLGIFAAWWSLGAAAISLIDRIAITLLLPLFFVITCGLVAASIGRRIILVGESVVRWNKDKPDAKKNTHRHHFFITARR